MSVSSTLITAKSLRIPRKDKSVLSHPSLLHAARLANETRQLFGSSDIRIGGIRLADWRDQVATDTLAAAAEYSADCGHSLPTHNSSGPLIVAGHQPTLFHCGVLIKNFAVARLARHLHGTPINLIIDNDIATPLHLAVPDGTPDQPATRLIPFAADSAARPWEDIKPDLSGAFTGFPDRVADALSRWNIRPVLPDIWPAAVSVAEQGRGLADCLSAARINLQDQFDHGTLELPISRLATRKPFLRFLALLLLDAERFADAHNRALAAYRITNRIRSRTHPAADLKRCDDWLETPFWCWHAGDTRRRRLMVRATQQSIAVSDGNSLEAQWPLTSVSDFTQLADTLGQWQNDGLKIRPSAISTTLFARAFLADLFVHGVGGSKYDAVTDSLMADFFRIPPPPFLTLSATLQLPLADASDVTTQDRSRLISRRRRMIHNAQDFLEDGQATELRHQKTSLIHQQLADSLDQSPTARQRRRERYQEFRRLNRELARHTIGARQALDGELQHLDRQLDANHVLTNREFAFCLFSAEHLRDFLEHALHELD